MNNFLHHLYGYNIYHNFDHQKYSLNLKGWNVNPQLYEKYIHDLKPKIIVELGTWLGASAIAMAKIIKQHKLDTKIICIDTWLGSHEFIGLKETDKDRLLYPINGYPSVYFQFLANVCKENVSDIIIPLPNTFKHGCRWLSLNNINADLVYVDGDNLLDSVYNDLNDAWSILSNNSIMFGDDFENVCFPGIRLALNKFCAEHKLPLTTPDNHPNFWNIKKIHN